MSAEVISGPNEHPIFRFFCQYPQQIRPLLRDYLIVHYFEKIAAFLDKNNIYGVLILDSYTLPIIGSLFTTSALTEYRLVLKDSLEKTRAPQPAMFGIYMVSRTLEAMQMIARDFGWGVNGSTHVASFSASVAEAKQATKGCCGPSGSKVQFPYKYKGLFILTPGPLPAKAESFVKSSGLIDLLSKAGVMTFNIDFIIKWNRFINLNQPEAFLVAYGMHRFNADVYESTKKQYISATVDKLWSLFNSLEMGPPEVRYYKGAAREAHFSLCKEVAEALNKKLQLTPVAPYNNSYPCVNSTIIIVDRAFDPVSLMAHHTLVGSFLPDMLDINDDLYLADSTTGQPCGLNNVKAATTQRKAANLIEIDLSESSDVWNGFRFMSMANFLLWQKDIIKVFRSFDPLDRDSVTMMSKPKEIAVNYGRHAGRIMKIPAYSLVDSSIFNVPYMTLSAQMNGVFTIIKKFADEVEAKGYLPLLLSAESTLLDVLVNGDRISNLGSISIGQERMSIIEIMQALSSPSTDATVALRLYLYTILILEKSGQTDRDLSESIYGRPLRDLINLSYNVSRLWQLDEGADFRALWTGFLQTFVTCDFVHLWQMMTKNKVHSGALHKAAEESRYIPALECIFRSFNDNPLSTTAESLFPIAESHSLAMAERRRRGAPVKRDVFVSNVSNAAAKYYPESPEGKELRTYLEKHEISSYRSREKVYIYMIGGVTPGDVSAAYRASGDSAIPEPSPFNSAYWTPTLGDFDCILISDDLYTPSRFVQRLAGLKPGILSSADELHEIAKNWSQNN